MLAIYSPLEQFYLIPVSILDSIPYFYLIRLDNFFFTLLLLFIYFFFILLGLFQNSYFEFSIIPTRWQFFFENIFLSVSSLLKENIQLDNRSKFFPIIAGIFFFIFSLNIFGIIPYSFTIMSQLISPFVLGLSVFIGINIIALRTHKIKFFSLFFPSGVSVVLGLLIVPIEIISFIFKPISLSVRLFANMMAGHTLLKVIAGFVWSLLLLKGIFSIFHFFPLLVLVVLFALEVGVAIIQSFVFSVLFCIYINDLFNIH